MSAQSAKKKRIGSRRRVPNQNEISKADEFHVGDSTSVAESHIPEEQTESLNVLANFDNSQSESQHPSSPELSGGRRKLGSSRRHKVRHVKDSVTESYHEAREEVEDKTREKETTVTKQTPLAIQSVRQEALSQGSEHNDMFATPDYSSEIQNTATTNYPEADLESLIPKGGNLPTDLDENENDSEVVSDSYKLAETTQEGIDISILHSEEVKERAHLVGIPELTSLSALSCPTVDQQLIDLSNFKEMPEEKLPSVCSVTEKEGKERDDDTESFRQDGNLQGSYLVSESHVESVVMQFSTTPEITTEKISPTENTEVECSVGQAILLSPKEELPTDEEQNEHFNLSEIRGAHHSEDDVNKQHEQEIRPTEKHMPHDDTENSEVISVNMTDQPEVSDTYQSELTEKSTDGSPTNQDISYPEDKEDEHPTDENNFELLQQNNEDYHVYDTKEPQISDLERVDSALGQVYEIEGRVEDDIKPSAEQTAHQEKEGLFSEVEESESSLLTVQSEINAPLDSQPQQDDTSFNPIGSRRKLGSSRRNRGRRHVKDSAAESDHEPIEDIVGNTRDNEPLEITEMSLTIETAVQEKSMETMLEGMDTFDSAQTEDVSDQVKENAHVGTQERDEDTESFRQDENLQTSYLVSETQSKSEDKEFSISPGVSSENSSPGEHTEIECSVEQAAFSSSKEEMSTNEERTEHVVSLGARPSEDVVNKVHEEVIKPTQMQEMPQIDNSSIKDRESSLQTMQSEHFDSQPLDNSQIITEQTHTGFSPKGNRRKLGSSRRQKGRLHVEDTTKMSLPMETKRQEELKEQTDLDFKFAGEIRSTVNNEGNTEKMLEEDTIVATDMTSSSGKDDFVKSSEEVNEEECKLIKETENLSQLGCDTVQMDLIQSLDVSATAVNMQQTNDTPENVGDVTKQDYETEAESSMHVQVYGLDEDGEQFEDITKKDHEAHEMNVSPDITHAERFSSAHDKTDTLAPFDVGLEENIQAEPAVDVSEESGISSQQGIQERTNLDDGENLQGRSKQKRRKLGSTRRIQLNRKPEEKRVERKDLNAEADMSSLDKIEVVEELTMTVTAEGSQNENAKPSLSPVDKEQQETISKALLPEQSASHNEEVVNPVKFVHVADVRDSERNVQPSQIDDFTVTEMHISDLLSANTEDSTSTGITDWDFVSSCETTQSTQGDEDRPASVNVTQDQSLKSAEAPVMADFEIVKSAVRGGAAKEHTSEQASEQEPDDADEGAHNKHLEMKNASPNLDSTNRRRKMGSSRRNLGSRTKREDLNQKQEVDDEATETKTNVGDVKTVSFLGNVEDEQQLHTEHKDSEQRKEPETVAYSHTDEENPVSHGQLVETEHQLTPSYLPSTPSTSPKHDSMSQSSPGRRRKMGSHRKSHGHQNHENQTAGGDRKTNNERDVRSIIDESAIKTTEELRERPHGLDKISEVDHSDKKPSSNISTAKEGELSRPVIEKTPEPVTPVQRPDAEIVLGQESQHKFSLGDSRGAGLRSNAYNVMMIGDSCVGKSSFMKRAQSGKFSLEIPASVGLDSCKWTVVVDGKPVVLQLWDTAGQERFHSLTRQIFHKAHAFLLMYDITSSQSFSAVSYWASCIQEGASEDVTILLAGNKSDCAERQVNTEKAEALAKEYHFEFMECSAATGENVVHCLETVARMLSQKVDTREEDLVLHKEPQQRKSGCC